MVFGHVVKGFSIVKAIEGVGSAWGGTRQTVKIADCGMVDLDES